MSEKIVKLATVAVDETRRQDARELLEKFAQDAEMEAVFVVVRRSDGTWIWDYAGNVFLTDMIGRIEIAKSELVKKYVESI